MRNLRSNKKEYNELKETLCGLDLYEDEMNLTEMRQMISALHESVVNDSSFNTSHYQEHGVANLAPFTPNNDGVLCSTFIGQPENRSSPRRRSYHGQSDSICFSSPEEPARVITVEADVHHIQDWTPNKAPLTKDDKEIPPISDDLQCRSENSKTRTKRSAMSDSGCSISSSSNEGSSASISISIHSSLMDSSQSSTQNSSMDGSKEQKSSATTSASSSCYKYSSECSSCMDYLVNRNDVTLSQSTSNCDEVETKENSI